MGIGILWDQIGEGEVTNNAQYASEHYEKTGRPLRIAIDTACWVYNNVTKAQTEQIRESSGRPSNPMEKAILHRLLRLLFLGIQLHFVFDGPKRPPKRGIVWRSTHDKSIDLLVKTLDMLGISWHKAYGEAEADCAELQKRGIVDAVWTEDGDAFMFGCTTLIRFHYEKKQGKESKSNTHFRIYEAEDIPKRLPGLDREGFVLYVILNGGDYDKAGLKGFGISNSLEAVKAGLGKSLCRAAESDLPRWREELVQYLGEAGSKVVVPPTFPVWAHLRDYREPLITQSLSSKWQQAKLIMETELKPFVQEYYNFQAEKWVEWIVPMLLIRTLMQTGPGKERGNAGYQVEIGKPNSITTVKATFLLSAATSLDMAQYAKNKDGSFYEKDFRATCETLPWILRRGVPNAVDEADKLANALKPKKPKSTKVAKAQPGDTIKSSSATVPAGTGRKRGRPKKIAKEDDKTPLTSTLETKRTRKLAELDSNLRLEISNPSAKREKLSSDLKTPPLQKSSNLSPTSFLQIPEIFSVTPKPFTGRQQATIIDLVSDDDAELPKLVVMKTKELLPSKRPSSQENTFSLDPKYALKSKQPDPAPTPKTIFLFQRRRGGHTNDIYFA
ncbi:PIN domain-like protein [Stipitochalara longipes BDJ]|nr:PIN domain-like protein [Stipitochalara longipes BDJ]